jgi:tetratricopeptide (TPR) repeat protein
MQLRYMDRRDIWQPITQRSAFKAKLAMALSNLSNHLSNLGRRDQALEAIQQAVDLRRQLAADRPMVFNAYLVDALDRLSDCLSDLGRQEAALHTTEEANNLRSLPIRV